MSQIAMCQGTSGNLNLIYLQNGLPVTFKQTADGRWHPTAADANGPNQIPYHGQLTFTAISSFSATVQPGAQIPPGLTAGLFLIATDGSLWITTQDGNDNWSPINQFPPPIPASPNNPSGAVAAVQAVWVEQGLLILTLASAHQQDGTIVGGLYSQLQTPNPLNVTAPLQIWTAASIPTAMAATSFNKFNEILTGGVIAYGPLNSIFAFTTSDGVNWIKVEQAELEAAPLAYSSPKALQFGSNAIQLLGSDSFGPLLDNLGSVSLAYDASEAGLAFLPYAENGGMLPGAVLPGGFSPISAFLGNNGNLQVVGINGGKPYLFWQDSSDASWHYYGQLQTTVGVTDLCMGMGNQQYLQVGYIGNDGNIYVNYQDMAGGWGWYGPLP